MSNYQLKNDEVILYEGQVSFEKLKSNINFTLTNQNMIFEKEKGIFKKKLKVIDMIPIENIKMYKEKVQIKQKNSTIKMQTTDKNVAFTCSNALEGKKIIEEIINIKTDSNTLDRAVKKANNLKKNLKSIANLSLACIMIPKAAIEIKENGKEIVKILKTILKR